MIYFAKAQNSSLLEGLLSTSLTPKGPVCGQSTLAQRYYHYTSLKN